jgi:hypothetical protein
MNMLAETLRQSVFLIRQYQEQSPDAYNCIKDDLDCLVEHINLVARYLSPATEEDLCITLPKTLHEIKSNTSVEA